MKLNCVRFRLRTLLIVITVICLVFGWRFDAIHQRNDAIRVIKSLGGSVSPIDMEGVRPDWWMRKRLLSKCGVTKECFNRFLESVGVRNECWHVISPGKNADEVAAACRAFDIVGVFSAFGSDITDVGITALSRLDVREIFIDDTAVTDNGVKQLRNSMSLHTLYLNSTEVGDDGIRELMPLGRDGKLHTLAITRTNITQQCFASLRSAMPVCRIQWSLREANRNGPNVEIDDVDIAGWTSEVPIPEEVGQVPLRGNMANQPMVPADLGP